MPQPPHGRKRPAASAGPVAMGIERWENEGGAPSTGDQSQHKGEIEEPFAGDFLEHPGSVGEMHFAYDNRNKDARRTRRPAKPPEFDWRKWFVPPIVIPAVIVALLLARGLYLYM